VPAEALAWSLKLEAVIPMTEICKDGFESQFPIISRCGAWLRVACAGFRYLDETMAKALSIF